MMALPAEFSAGAWLVNYYFYYLTINFNVHFHLLNTKKLNSVALVRKRTIPNERPPLVDEVSDNFCG
jgi:hypothetical protein